jgi:hypothetical protein
MEKFQRLFWHFIPLIFLLVLAVPLRFINLGYSEFQDDEKKSLIRVESPSLQNYYKFFMEQRKGPMQWIVSSVPLAITGDPRNELAQRLPFALINLASVFALYIFVWLVTRSRIGAFVAAALYMSCGFIVGFSRISQYQNLNLLFSFIALIFYHFFAVSTRKNLTYSLLGTFFTCLSLLSHWDVVYLAPIILYFVFAYSKNSQAARQFKIRLIALNVGLFCLMLLPFLVPYVITQLQNSASTAYFNRRVGLSDYSFERHRFIFELYNPFYTIYIYAVLGVLGILFFRRSVPYVLWFLLSFLAIKYFMTKPGTHIYNYLLPVFVLAGIGVGGVAALFKNAFWKAFVIALCLPAIVFEVLVHL